MDQRRVDGWVDKLHAWDGNLFAATSIDKNSRAVLDSLTEFKWVMRACVCVCMREGAG